ncbi:MAG: SpoIIE family protein phosphatase [Desulfofustis sp.]|jgi:sigma-B regulation protein RsbU (phosphoserine phosphatase)|nr:SpoIIE family protein phosphatase [Desulfofustis sp.]
MASLSPVHLGIIIGSGFLVLLVFRQLLIKKVIESADPDEQPRRMFFLEMFICICAAMLIIAYQSMILHFPLLSNLSLLIGCIIAGFFIGINSFLIKERAAIVNAMKIGQYSGRPIKYSPITLKFTLIAGTTFVFVCIVLVMVFSRDVEWLANTAADEESIASAQLSVIYEILFIMTVLMIMIFNLIIAYSRNLKLLFNNETGVLEKVRNGDLSSKVPVATQDEFGVIADHTNHMIDGLRHRFELVHSLKLAEEVQQNLLPTKSPYLRGYDVSGMSMYCDQTGGDYYDYFLLPDDRLGIVVADACGHGVGAAMLMTTVRAFLISAVETYSDPAHLLNQINQWISRDCASSGTFTTMFFMELDPAVRTLRWIRAGHEPALHYHRRTAQVTRLDGTGIVLGIDASYRFENQITERVDSGDIILIGTDGIFETRNSDNVIFGQPAVNRIIAEQCEQPASAIREALVAEVKKFRGDMAQEDDITLVVVKVQ